MKRKEFKQIESEELKVGMGCSGTFYTDLTPFEIVRVISDKTIEVRKLDVEITKPDLEDPEYKLYINEENPIVRVRKCKNGWKMANGMRIGIGNAIYYRDPTF